MKKIIKNNIFGFILGAIIFGSIVNATEIEFSSTEDDWKTNANIKTVQEALDYLHNNM